MINLKKFLKSQDKSFYTFVTYNGITEPTYFSLIWDVIEPWFLESSCELQFYNKKAVVDNFQVAPYLWEYEIEDIKVVNDKEVLRYLLKEIGVINNG